MQAPRPSLRPLPHQVLGVSADASLPEVKAAFRRLAKQHHPDKGGVAADFKFLVESYEAIAAPKCTAPKYVDVAMERAAPEAIAAERPRVASLLAALGEYSIESIPGRLKNVPSARLEATVQYLTAPALTDAERQHRAKAPQAPQRIRGVQWGTSSGQVSLSWESMTIQSPAIRDFDSLVDFHAEALGLRKLAVAAITNGKSIPEAALHFEDPCIPCRFSCHFFIGGSQVRTPITDHSTACACACGEPRKSNRGGELP